MDERLEGEEFLDVSLCIGAVTERVVQYTTTASDAAGAEGDTHAGVEDVTMGLEGRKWCQCSHPGRVLFLSRYCCACCNIGVYTHTPTCCVFCYAQT